MSTLSELVSDTKFKFVGDLEANFSTEEFVFQTENKIWQIEL